MTKFIVISGKKQAGKTTAANFIVEILRQKYIDIHRYIRNLETERVYEKTGEISLDSLICLPTNLVKITSFAAPIKDFCINTIGLTQEQVYGTNEQKNSPTHIEWYSMPEGIIFDNNICEDRKMTAREVMQIFGTDIMRQCFDFDIWAKAPFNRSWGSIKFVIIDDCRFPNEADIALENDALLIRLERNVLGEDVHVSEKALDNYDSSRYNHVIDNSNYELNELRDNLFALLNREEKRLFNGAT